MIRSSTYEYWKYLRNSWNDSFVAEVIQDLHRIDRVVELGRSIGYEESAILAGIEGIEASTEPLGWKLFDYIWVESFKDLSTISAELKFKVERLPLIGTIPTGRINAMAIKSPQEEEYILAFEVGLFDMICRVCDYLANYLEPSMGAGTSYNYKVKEKVLPESITKVTTMLLRYYAQGLPFLEENIQLVDSQKMLSRRLRRIVQLFVTGHEYGHIALKHLENGISQSFGLIDSTTHDEIFPVGHTQELQADQAGFLISSCFHVKKGVPFWFSGAIITYFLTFSGLIYSGLSFLLDKQITDPSHPPIEERVNSIEESLLKIIKDTEFDTYLAFKKMCSKLLEEVNNSLMKDLMVLKESGLFILSPIWNRFR
ncbi:MAG: hypothetical protein AAF655_19285 [Bacteroidota bacterium]